MTLTRTRPIQAGFPTALDDRKLESAMVPRQGVFPDPITLANGGNGIASAGTGWGVNAAAFVAASKYGNAAYERVYGTAYVCNDATVVGAWTVPSAPGSGIQYSRLWVKALDPSQGDATSGNDGPITTAYPGGSPRAVPAFGVTSAAAGAGLPALPTGVIEIAQVAVPSGAASIAGATITNVYAFTALLGQPLPVRNATELAALTGMTQGDKAKRLDDQLEYTYFAAYNAATNPLGTSVPRGTPTAGWYVSPNQHVGCLLTYNNGAYGSGIEANIANFTREFDPFVFYNAASSTTQVKPTRAGRYRLEYSVVWSGSGGDRRLARMRLNGSGSDINGGMTIDANAPGQGMIIVEEEVFFNGTTDYVDYTLYQSSGGNLSVIVRLTFVYLGPPQGA